MKGINKKLAINDAINTTNKKLIPDRCCPRNFTIT